MRQKNILMLRVIKFQEIWGLYNQEVVKWIILILKKEFFWINWIIIK